MGAVGQPGELSSCSDVVFDGGNGEVTGIRDSATPDPDPSTPAPDPTHTGSCMAVYEVVNSWDGGFQGSVEVMNHSASPLNGWAVQWKPGDGTRLTSVLNGALSTASHGTVTVRDVDHNRTVAADGTTAFGFTASSSSGNNGPAGTVGCVMP